MSGNFLSCSKVVKDPLEIAEVRSDYPETPQHKCASSRLEGRTSWIFELRQVLSFYDGDLRVPLWWPQERPVPMRVARGPLGIPLPSMLGPPKTLCGVSFRPEDSSPVPTWILGYFWSLLSGVSPCLVWGHARALSSHAVAAVSGFPSRGSRDLWLSLEAFPQGCPTCHCGVNRSSA